MSVSFFLGANTPQGFYSLFNELYNPDKNEQIYIIKGGPGTGKSSMMKKVAAEAEKRGYSVERIPCSSDPLSLDGVIIPELNTAIADATSPHIINPVFPGVTEHTVDPGRFWSVNKLRTNGDKIKKITLNNSEFHKQCIKYLKAASVIENDISNIFTELFNKEKAQRFAERFCFKELSSTEKDSGKIQKRFLSAVTPLGVVVQYESFFNMCDKIITISDNSSIISGEIIKTINNYAGERGIDRIICMCPMNPEKKYEHIIFPNLRIGVFTSNIYHPMIKKNGKTIHFERFINENELSSYKNKLSFLKKAKLELIGESIRSLEQAKASHDILESYYIAAMDFRGVSKMTDELIEKIFS